MLRAHIPRDKTIFVMACVLVLAVAIALVALVGPWWPDGLATLPATRARVIRLVSQGIEPGPELPAFEPTAPEGILPTGVKSLATIAGPLSIGSSESGEHLVLNRKRLALPGPRFTLLAMLRRPGQDIVLVGVRCGGTTCRYAELVFLRLFAERPPLVETRPELRVPASSFDSLVQHIGFAGDTMKVPLAIEQNQRLVATIGTEQPLDLTRTQLRTGPLTGKECGAVRRLVVECAAFRLPCNDEANGSFPKNCPSANPRLSQDVARLAAATSSFDPAAFAKVCSRASHLRIAPSDDFIRRELCSGRRR
jgi:hypothetical protein